METITKQLGLFTAQVAQPVRIAKPEISPAEIAEMIALDEMPADKMTPGQVGRWAELDDLYRACRFVRLGMSAAEHARKERGE